MDQCIFTVCTKPNVGICCCYPQAYLLIVRLYVTARTDCRRQLDAMLFDVGMLFITTRILSKTLRLSRLYRLSRHVLD